jgi:hypothetical protein
MRILERPYRTAPLVVFGLLLSANATEAFAQTHITQFLANMYTNHVVVELIHLDVTKGTPPISAARPDAHYIAAGQPGPVTLGGGCYANLARSQLKRALSQVRPIPPSPPPPPIRPDYCLVSYDGAGLPTSVLWIDSAISSLQMQFRSSAVNDSASPLIDVRGRLRQIAEFATVHSSACDEICTLLDAIESGPLAFDLASVDPKLVDTVFDQPPFGQTPKPWAILGKLTIAIGEEGKREDIVDALTGAITPPPRVTSFFTPRLAVAVTVSSPTSSGCATLDPGLYVLLMSFECRKVQLWRVRSGQPTKIAELPINNAGADQILNNLLDADHKPWKPKSTASSD